MLIAVDAFLLVSFAHVLLVPPLLGLIEDADQKGRVVGALVLQSLASVFTELAENLKKSFNFCVSNCLANVEKVN